MDEEVSEIRAGQEDNMHRQVCMRHCAGSKELEVEVAYREM
jgi:hypothetical protein